MLESDRNADRELAGGGAGMMEALVCHPLDTVKVRMQLSRRARAPGVSHIMTCIGDKATANMLSILGQASWLRSDRYGDRAQGDCNGSVQRPGCCAGRHYPEDGHSIHLI